MLTLYELKDLLGDAVDNWKDDTPRPSVLRNSGVGIMTDTVVDDDTLLEVYENGLVLYETNLHHTVFPINDALKDYTYDSVASGKCGSSVIPLSVFYDMPWVFRVLIEAEDRVVHNMYTSPTIEGCAPLTAVMEQILKMRDDSHDVLDIILWKELMDVLEESEHALTEYQKYIVNAVFTEDRSVREMSEEVKKSRQAIEDVISRGLINMRKVFRDMGFEIESSLLKYK